MLQLETVENKKIGPSTKSTNRGCEGAQQTASQPTCDLDQENSLSSSPSSRSTGPAPSKKPDPSVRPAWGKVTTIDSDSHAFKMSRSFKDSILNEEDFPALRSNSTVSQLVSIGSDAPAVQAPAIEKTMSLRGPERPLELENDIEDAHPISSQKKIKKAQREAKRKAKKVSEHEETSNHKALNEFGRKGVTQALSRTSPSALMASRTPDAKLDAILPTPKPDSGPLTNVAVERVVVVGVAAPVQQLNSIDTPVPVTPANLPCAPHRKHDSWTRFARFLVVDQLTAPCLQSFEDCSHGSTCLFESLGLTDCPFHKPRKLLQMSDYLFANLVPQIAPTMIQCVIYAVLCTLARGLSLLGHSIEHMARGVWQPISSMKRQRIG